MSTLMVILTGISLAVLVCISVWQFIRGRDVRQLVIQLGAIGLIFVFLYTFFFMPAGVIAKGGADEVYFIIALYICMLSGMFANYGYARYTKAKRSRGKFDFGTFIAPVFASPIVFIPLLAAFQDTNVELKHFISGKMMIFLVAFQNGFFWKEYFDNVQREKRREKSTQRKKKTSS